MKRLTDQELETLLDELESDRVERKESFSGDVPKKARQAVCAFANDLPNHNKPGILFIGAKDNGQPSNVEITDQLLINLANIKTDGRILPLPVFSVEKRILKGVDIAVVTVIPSDMPPVKFEGRTWIRAGSRRAIANEQEERILIEKRRYKTLPFDLYPIPTANINDLSKTIFENEYLPAAFAEDILEANGRTYEERLASSRMIVSPEKNASPTVLGLLAIGKSPQDFIPGAYIQFLRLNGTELNAPVLDAEEMRGTIVDILRRTEDKLKAHNQIAVDVVSGPTHQILPLYPMPALRQLLYNAVLHRTYEITNAPVRVYWFDDRIEIISPGGPYGNVTEVNFGQPGITDYRNPNIASVMKTFGLIQAFGRGIAIAKGELKKNGNPELEFQVNSSVVSSIIRKK